MNSVIILAAGTGSRAKQNKNKILVPVGGGDNSLIRSLSAFLKSGLFGEYIVAVNKSDEKEIRSFLPETVKTVAGGNTRTESVKNALKEVTGDYVLIHDAARPYLSERLIKDCLAAAEKHGGAIPVVPSRDTVCEAKDGRITDYLGKDGLFSVQTPQAFDTAKLREAYAFAKDKAFNDDGEVYKNRFGELFAVTGDKENVKLTYPEDFAKFSQKEYRFGTGFDCHRLVTGRKLILGGVEIPHDKGLLGHSDADALVHAVMDAVLSACAMRDIGYYFPDTDERYKDADSMELLKTVLNLIAEKGFKVSSVSAVVMAEKPKLKNFIPAITESLAAALSLDVSAVGLSATTLEGLGFVGREEGICVSATATVIKL